MTGLSLVVAGGSRARVRGRAARAELKQAQQSADLVNRDRDRLLTRQHDADGTHDEPRSSFRRYGRGDRTDPATPAPTTL